MTPDDDWPHRIERVPATKGDLLIFHVDPLCLADVEGFQQARRDLAKLGIPSLVFLVSHPDAITIDAYTAALDRDRLLRDLPALLAPYGLTVTRR